MMYKTNMSYLGMQKFEKHLQKLGLLRLEDDATKYVATEKGRQFISKYVELQELLRQ